MVIGAEWMSMRADLSCHKTNQNVETRKNGPEGTREAVVKPSARLELCFLSICKVFYCPLWEHLRHRNSPAFLFLLYMKLSDFHMSIERWKGRLRTLWSVTWVTNCCPDVSLSTHIMGMSTWCSAHLRTEASRIYSLKNRKDQNKTSQNTHRVDSSHY